MHWPIHRWAAIVLVAALALPNELVTVSLGDLWPAAPPLLYPVLAAAQLGPLWWVGVRPLSMLTVTCIAFVVAQAFAWQDSSADLAVFVALTMVGVRARPRIALVTAAVATAAAAGYMTAAQAPGRPEMIVQAVVPAAVLTTSPPRRSCVTRTTRTRRSRVCRTPGPSRPSG